jgi:hypothetical protein
MTDQDIGTLSEVQTTTAEWREATLEGEPTVETQAAHTAVEAAEVLDILVKGQTYQDGDSFGVTDDLVKELGDVVVAHLGTMTLVDEEARWAEAEAGGARSLALAITLLQNATVLSSDASSGYVSPVARKSGHLLHIHARLCDALGVTQQECVAAALEKNGARDWAEHQGEATR